MTKFILAIFCVFLTLSAGCAGLPIPGGASQPPTASETPEVASSTDTSGSEAPVVTSEPENPAEDVVPTLMSPPSGPERIEGIALGQPAPYEGIILNGDAAAWLESEPDAVQQRCQLFVSRRVGELRARLAADTDRLQLRIDTLTQVHGIELRARDAQIQTLLQTNEELRNRGGQWWEQALWVGGALILGVAIGIIVGIVAN